MGEQGTRSDGDPVVVSFRDEDARDLALVGGKGANIARLFDAGLPVPGGFCVTTAAYRTLLDDDLRRAIAELDDLDATDTETLSANASEIRAELRERKLPDAVSEAVEDALGALDADDQSFAVRSSATAEDLPDASFAGQHETFLEVSPAEVPDRLLDCVASLFTDRAVAYRARNGISHADVSMAVVVQPMVDAVAAGVLFTADPATNSRRVATVDATFGLGQALVAGETTPDHARIDRETGEVLEYTVNEAARTLSDEQLRTLVRLGDRAEGLLGSPQDVEWALGDDGFVLLQSRPITSLFPLPTPAPDDDRLHVYVSLGHLQAIPEAFPPLACDVWRELLDKYPEMFGVESFWSSPGAEAGGRVYLDVTALLGLGVARRHLPWRLALLNEPAARGLNDLLDRRGDEFPAWRVKLTDLPKAASASWRFSKLLLSVVPAMLWKAIGSIFGRPQDPERVEVFFERWGERTAANVRCHDTPEARARAVFDSLDFPRVLKDIYPEIGPLVAAFAIGGWLKRRFPEAPAEVNAVGQGFERELVTRINLGLGDLADVARKHPEVADAIRDGKSLAEIESVAGGEEFVGAFDDYLAEFGHRATGELDVSRPRWREDPSGLLATIRANLAHGAPGDHRERLRRVTADAETAAERLERRADEGLLGPVRRRVVRKLIRSYRAHVQMREYPKQGFAHALAAWHDALEAAGEVLAERGTIETPDDVWFLRKEELFAALDGEESAVDIPARRAEFERHAEMDAPPLVTSEGEIPEGKPVAGIPEGTLVGTGVSGGVVEATARVVRNPNEATVERGEILVAPSTDPGWTPMFLNAAGLVSEVGGPVSHGALVAREYGLPAVVSVPEATRKIQTGDRVRIDGTQGTVEILDDEGGEGVEEVETREEMI
ncbi:PEP/pyruvate-binding domain-containing protein [Halorussus halophilus]|uniref:PEP/pyruvate-binding domain-containing protein n=1 Tax=Halorussus halophilus TaxID=2650975 RepID=UPI0013010FBA|nr:PEP/pyruvate-binding domain-containing protein [Halorussus halophilus]